jgi:hypothetical protein
MTTMTKAAEAEAAIAQVADLIDRLRGVIEQETALVHAGKVRDAGTLAPQKSELTSKLYVVGERLKANAKFLPQAAPAQVAALHSLQDAFRSVLQRNMIGSRRRMPCRRASCAGCPAISRARRRRKSMAHPAVR